MRFQPANGGADQAPLLRLVATVLGLTGSAFAVPSLVVLGSNPTFFAAHGAGQVDVITLAAVIAFGPATILVAPVLLLRKLAPRITEIALAILVGVALAAMLVPPITLLVPIGLPGGALIGIFIAISVAIIHRRKREVRNLVAWSALAPLAVLVWFLTLSPTGAFLRPQPEVSVVRAEESPNVLVVVFDELPLAALVDRDGKIINDERFPGFGSLSRRSTWYRHATTVAPWTNLAVPAIFSGRAPTHPVPAGYYSRNVFAMLESTYELHVIEPVTRLCVARACREPTSRRLLYEDAAIVSLRATLPYAVADRWLPVIGDRWTGFRDETSQEDPGFLARSNQANSLERFTESVNLSSPDRPNAWIGHFVLPHFPLTHLPDGRIYDRSSIPPGLTSNRVNWKHDLALIDVGMQRFVLQLRYADLQLQRLLRAVDEAGASDETLIVVTADHGLSFTPGSRRGAPYSAEKAPEILPVPLFIKYPHQKAGVTDDRPAQVIDILPTIADALSVDLPRDWMFDGISLNDPDVSGSRQPTYFDGGPKVTLPREIAVGPIAERYSHLFGGWRGRHDTFAWGPHWRLVGKPVGDAREPEEALAATLVGEQSLSFNETDVLVPALIQLRFDKAPDVDWFAISLHGSVAGLGRVYNDREGPAGVAVIDPVFLKVGRNTPGGYLIGPDGSLTRFAVSSDQ